MKHPTAAKGLFNLVQRSKNGASRFHLASGLLISPSTAVTAVSRTMVLVLGLVTPGDDWAVV